MKQPFEPVNPIRRRPIKPSYAPANVRELERLEGNNQPPFLLDAPGAIVRSPGAAVSPKDPAAIVHNPRGLAVHQSYPVYATPGFVSSEKVPATHLQTAAKVRFRLRFRVWWKPRKSQPPKRQFKLPKLPKLKLPRLSLAASKPASQGKPASSNKPQGKPASQPSKPSERAAGLSGLKLPKPALSGASFGSIGLGGKSGKSGSKGGSDNFGDDPIAQLLVKIFLTLLILIPLIL